MTKFIYLADSHFGASPMGYQQQRGYPERLREILVALRRYLERESGIAFILHGGDMVDATNREDILAAAELFDLDVPLYLCLGNHDLTAPDALDTWLQMAPQFFPNGRPEYSIRTDNCVIHVVPNQWCPHPYYWEGAQDIHFLPEQLRFLEEQLTADVDCTHLVLTHSPILGLPPQQTGFEDDYHAPIDSFRDSFLQLCARHPNLRCVLGAHNHLNMCVTQGGTRFVTTSALVETPFEVKLFEVTPQSLGMSTMTLAGTMNDSGEYDYNKSFVQGRAVDRGFQLTF